MGLAFVATVLSTVHLEGDVTAAGGDYVDVSFTVPANTVEIQVKHDDNSDFSILDFGVWAPEGFRGWGGGNTEDIIIGVDQSSRSYLPGPITPGTWTVSIGKAKLASTGAHYTLDIECRDNATLTPLPRADYTPVTISSERRWYKGDFHVHSVQSGDATATFQQISDYARGRGLDFVNLSDHNTYAQHALIAAYLPSVPDFLMLRGTEITTYSGHGNSVGTDKYIDHRLGLNGRTVTGMIDDVAADGGIFIVNHAMLDLGDTCIGCAWKHVDDTPWAEVTGIELITGNFDIGVQAFVPRVLTLWDSLLDQGYKIAGIGGSDDHRAGMDSGPTSSSIGSPTTLVLADNLSEAGIIDALRKGRTVVQMRGPDDPLVELKIGKAEIGDTVEKVSSVTLEAHIMGAEAGMQAQLWRDGVKIAQKEVPAGNSTTKFDDTPGHQLRRYRIELINDVNQPVVITSHIYVDGEEDGCGCSTRSPRGGWVMAFALLALRRRRKRR